MLSTSHSGDLKTHCYIFVPELIEACCAKPTPLLLFYLCQILEITEDFQSSIKLISSTSEWQSSQVLPALVSYVFLYLFFLPSLIITWSLCAKFGWDKFTPILFQKLQDATFAQIMDFFLLVMPNPRPAPPPTERY